MIPGLTHEETLTLLTNLARAGAILIVGLVAARLVRAWILRLGLKKRLAANTAALLGNLAQVGIVIFALILILPSFGVDWTGLLTLVGAVGLAASLAFQDLLKNIIAGIYILIERPFQIGDTITIQRVGGPVSGTVQSIELRVSNLRTVDGLQLIVPNGTLFTEIVVNRSAINLQRRVISVTTAPGDQTLSSLTAKIGDALAEVPDVSKNPAPSTRVESVSPTALKLHVELWAPPQASRQALEATVLALRDALPSAEVAVVS